MVTQRSWWSPGDQLLPGVYLVILLIFCSSIAFVPTNVPYNPDEARIVNAARESGTGWPDWVRANHLLGQVDLYVMSELVTVTIRGLRVVAALFTILSCVYLAWLSYTYALFSRVSLLILLLLLSTNFPVHRYGGWGAFDYAQRMLISVGLLHALLFLHKTGLHPPWRALALLVAGFCLLTVGYAANILPIVLLVIAAYCCRRSYDQGTDSPPPRTVTTRALVLLVPAISVGLITLIYFTHGEFRNPRDEILGLYFPTSEFPQSAGGLVSFLGAMTGSLLASTFAVWPHAPDYVSRVIVIAFGIGLVGSLFERNPDSRRFITGVYVLLVLACLAGLSAVGMYAFGDIRYALFVHGPLLVVAAFGITDVGRWVGQAANASARRFMTPAALDRARTLGMAVLAALVLMACLDAAGRIRKIKSDYDREFGAAVQLITTDRSPLVVYDAFSQMNLDAIGIDFPDKRAFVFDLPFVAGLPDSHTDFDEYRGFLGTEQDVLWITFFPDTARQFADYVAEIERTHVRARELNFASWQITRWESAEATSLAGPLRGGDNGRANPPPVVTRAEAGRLLPAYGGALERQASHPGMVVDASQLPDSKARLKSAILTFLDDASDADDSTAKELLRGVFIQLAVFQEGVGDTPVAVHLAAPDGRSWREVTAQERRALAAELADAGH